MLKRHTLRKRALVCILSSTLLFASCSGGGATGSAKNQGVGNRDTTTARGRVIDSLACPDFARMTYAVYLPSGYKPSKKYPCIYCFDSHANGALPLRRYKNLAEEFGLILIGSNESRNGMSWQDINRGIGEMMEDSRRRFNIDSANIFTCGFSGGGKVASSVAIFDGGISGVISCAGSLPALDQEIQARFDYFGIVGDLDFNMVGLEILHEKMGEYGFNQQIITFNGKHVWPDAAEMRTAILWMMVRSMRKGAMVRNDEWVKALKTDYDQRLEQAVKAEDLVWTRRLLMGITSTIDTLLNLDSYRKDLAALQASPGLRNAVALEVQRQHNEMSLQDTLAKKYTENDVNWWHTQIAELNLNIKTAEKKEDSRMYSRVVAYLSMVGYISTTRALKSNDLTQAANCLKIFEMADPKNPDCSFLAAQVALKSGKNAAALKLLETAAELGYNEPYQLLTLPELAPIRNELKFRDILVSVQQNAKGI
jgi:dienelactone hydrolase